MTEIYSPLEERLNVITHAFGFLASIIGVIFLLIKATATHNTPHIMSALLFGVGMLSVFAASTLYHNSVNTTIRSRLRIFDHAAIYVLIAGTYTPFALVTLYDSIGLPILISVWSMAIFGIIFKLFFTGKFNIISTSLYVCMGWMVVFFINPLIDSLSSAGFYWLLSGGIAYTVGAVLFSIEKIKFNHALFHIMVLIGCFCHFMCIFWHVL